MRPFAGHLELIQFQLKNDVMGWSNKYKRPAIITEYGADTMTGIHATPDLAVLLLPSAVARSLRLTDIQLIFRACSLRRTIRPTS
jgi:hypothetical protein